MNPMPQRIQKIIYQESSKKLLWHPNTGHVLLGVLFICFVLLIMFLTNYVRYNDQFRELSQLKVQFETLEKNNAIIKQLDQHVLSQDKQYKQFIHKKFATPIHIKTIQERIKILQKQLKIQFLKATFTKIPMIDNPLPLLTYDIQFDIKVLRDQQFFQFLDKILREGPGIVEVKDFYLKRLGPVTQDLLKKIRDNKSILFDGKIIVKWTFLNKDKQSS